MRSIFTKAVAVSLIAGAGLAVSACTSETSTNVTNTTTVEVPVDNVVVVDDMTGGMDAGNGMGTIDNGTSFGNATVGNTM